MRATFQEEKARAKQRAIEDGESKQPENLSRFGQAFIATLLFDPSMSALPIMETQKSQSVGLLTHIPCRVSGPIVSKLRYDAGNRTKYDFRDRGPPKPEVRAVVEKVPSVAATLELFDVDAGGWNVSCLDQEFVVLP